jgi:hypothetical protein
MSGKSKSHTRYGIAAAIALTGVIAFSAAPAAADSPNTCNTITIGSLSATGSPNPGVGDQGVDVTSVNASNPQSMTGTLNTPSMGNHCSSSTTVNTVADGTNEGFEWAVQSTTDTSGNTVLVPTACVQGVQSFLPHPDGTYVDGTYMPDGNFGPTTGSQFTSSFDTAGFVGAFQTTAVVGFRSAHLADGSYGRSFSPCINVNFTTNPPPTGPCATTGTGVTMNLISVNGIGTPPVGSSGPWTYVFAICAYQDITLQSAQGGTSAWTTFDNQDPGAISGVAYDASGTLIPGTVPTSGSPTNAGTANCQQRKPTGGGNSIELCEWTNIMGKGNSWIGGVNVPNRGYALVTVTVNGTVKGSSGTLLNISGNWSALYYAGLNQSTGAIIKTNYTELALVQVP